MNDSRPTRVSLLVRVRDARDEQAWSEFVEIYAPLVYRYARKHGLQDADAADLTQDVLRSVARAMPAFEYEPQRARFRTWLFTVAGNQLRSHLASRQQRLRGTGDTGVQSLLEEQPAGDESDEQYWNCEYQKRVFDWAAARVRGRFQETTWQAFRQTAVDGRPPQEVAAQLGLTVGAVYIAKSRVLARLREEIETMLGQDFFPLA